MFYYTRYLLDDFVVSIIKNMTGDSSDKGNHISIALVTACSKVFEIFPLKNGRNIFENC